MDPFEVKADNTSLLESSHIVSELQQGCSEMEMFPVLIDEQVAYFHDVDGGFNKSGEYHIVNLIHRVQGHDSPPNMLYDSTVEAHLEENFYQMDVTDIIQLGSYPDDDYILSLKVTDYRMGPYSFSEALSADIDKREQEFSHNNE